FFASLLSSIILYWLSPFHPLAKVPGPMMHKVSKLWSIWICWQGRQHTEFKAIYDKYGSVVRTGMWGTCILLPRFIMSQESSSLTATHMNDMATRVPRSTRPTISLKFSYSHQREAFWNCGFNAGSIEEYDKILAKSATQLVDGIQAHSVLQGEVDLITCSSHTNNVSLYSYDFMADFVFGGGLDMLKEGKDEKGILELLEHHIITGALVSHIPWFFYLRNRIPGATQLTLKMHAHTTMKWVQDRLKKGAEIKDLWYHLTDEAACEKEEQPLWKEVVADVLMAIIAGADTTSVALTNFFYLILKHPKHYQHVQEEVDRVYADADATDISKQSSNFFLIGPLRMFTRDEALHLLPPGLTGRPRQVPQDGRMIAGYFLPEGTQVYLPPYVMHRNPECFYPCTNDFVPSQWLSTADSDSDLENPLSGKIHDRKVFLSFSFGPANCVGKKLARREMLMVISLMMQRFRFAFAKDFNWERWLHTMKDFFATSRGPLRVVAGTK
ncbi:cytochrome P450, partial [Lentinula lateritia]